MMPLDFLSRIHFFSVVFVGALWCFSQSVSHAANNLLQDVKPLQISQSGDLELSCLEVSQEISRMEQLAMQAQQIRDEAKMTNAGISVGKAVGSYLVGSLVGGIGIIAAGYLVNEAANDHIEETVFFQTTAIQRRSFMAGIYNAKGCSGPLRLALIEPRAGEEEQKLHYKGKHPLTPRYSYND